MFYFVLLVQACVIAALAARMRGERSRAKAEGEGASGSTALDPRGMLEHLGVAIAVQDRHDKLVYANKLAAHLLGFDSPEALLAAPIPTLMEQFDVYDHDGRPLTPADLPGRKVLAGEGPTELLVRFRRRGHADEQWQILRASPVLGPDGQVELAVNVFRDVSEDRRFELEAKLGEMPRAFISRATAEIASSIDYEATLRNVARMAVPDFADWAAVDLLLDGRVQRLAVAHVDPEKIRLVEELSRRYPPRSELEDPVKRIIKTGEAELFSNITRDLIRATTQDEEQARMIEAIGLVSYISVPLRSEGETVGAITFATSESKRRYSQKDLAIARTLADRASIALDHARLFRELERTRAEAVDASRAKDEFLAMLGHELRNPLAPILTALQLMQLRQPNVMTKERAIIERQVRHVVRLVDDLLDVSRITRGMISLHKAPVALDTVVRQAVEMSEPLLDEHKQTLTIAVPAELVVDADEGRLAQVFANLLNNAAKFTPHGGRISVTAARAGDDIVCSVRDTGVGISSDMLPRVFDLFVQERQTLDRSTGGLGLGLSLVRSIVRMHGGQVTAHSEGLGKGTEFRVTLEAASARAAAAPSVREATAASARATRVLVVDDNAEAAQALAEGLSLLDYDVHTAYDGPEALELAVRVQPQVALLDIGLPVMDGYELARRLRDLPALARVKLIAVTGYGQSSDRERSKAAGFDAHLVKPIDLRQVQQTMEKLLAESGDSTATRA